MFKTKRSEIMNRITKQLLINNYAVHGRMIFAAVNALLIRE